jgi:hypothetical protein
VSGIAQRHRGAGAPKSGRACDLLTASLINTGHHLREGERSIGRRPIGATIGGRL